MSRLFDLTGKVAIVTGSSRGIGLAIAAALAEQGAKVVISSRKQDACDEVAHAINAQHGPGTAIAVAASISDKAALQNLVDRTQAEYGRVDILVCNAASNPYYGPMAGISDEQFRKILDNNVLANHWLISMVAPQMLDRGAGSIIIISSVGGLQHLQGRRLPARPQPRRRVRPARRARQLHRPGPRQDRLREGAVGKSRHAESRHARHPAAPHRRTARDRRRRGLPRRPRLDLHDRPGDGRRRRQHDRDRAVSFVSLRRQGPSLGSCLGSHQGSTLMGAVRGRARSAHGQA
jgi:NAD(P)-dependent dehydrogenase (short-subunit alcohol dehydrogenase family)